MEIIPRASPLLLKHVSEELLIRENVDTINFNFKINNVLITFLRQRVMYFTFLLIFPFNVSNHSTKLL